ncbi:MAG TPA: hypothetical protein VD905_05500 [Flavobacteriales bacterium]|nr:hypothetical protein [Flavobacteriales bacterium]
MKPTTELYDLIKSLSKSEKRFFKLSSSLQAGEKNYIRLFDAIEEQEEYDEERIKQKFKGETFIQHFPSEKNHLYKQILKALRNFHAENSINNILRIEIKNIEILYKKALYKECAKFVGRAKKMALEHEKFYYLFELINWEKQLLEEEYETGGFDKDLDDLISQETECIQKLRNLAEYHMIYSRVNYVIRKGGFARNDSERKIVNELENYHLIKGKNTALSSRAASICYYIKGVCNAFNRNYDEALVNFKKVKDIIDHKEHLKIDLAQRYVRTLSLILTCYIELQDYEKAYQVIEEIKSLNEEDGFTDTNTQLRIQTTVFISTLQICNKTGNHEKGAALIPEIIKLLDKNAAKINKEQVIEFYVNIAGVYFINNDYKEALYWLNKVLNDNEKMLRRDLYNFARIFNLIIHYELGNNDLLEYVIKSTARQLTKDDNDYAPEELVIKHLRKLIKFNNEKSRFDTYKDMKNDFDHMFNTNQEKVLLDYFDINAWVESKIKGQKFAGVLQQLTL